MSIISQLPSSATVFTVNPADFNLVEVMPDELRGAITGAPNNVVPVNYPASLGNQSIDEGVTNLDNNVSALSEGTKVILFVYSEGATVASIWLANHAAQCPIPPSDLAVVMIGNPNRITGFYHAVNPNTDEIYWKTTPTDSKYPVYDIARKGDGWANWANLNIFQGLIGMYTTHMDYFGVDVDDPSNEISQSGTTTYITTK